MDELGLLPILAAHAARERGVAYMLDDAPSSAGLLARLDLAQRLARRLLAVLVLAGRVVVGDDGRVVPGPAGWPEAPAPPAATLLVRILRRGVALSEAEIQAHPEARRFEEALEPVVPKSTGEPAFPAAPVFVSTKRPCSTVVEPS